MPRVDWNRETWDGNYNWQNRGDEWSAGWGGPYMQWYGTLLPRIHRFVPTGSILEIAPGYGRWTQFLRRLCTSYVGVDLSQACVDACRSRFADDPHLRFEVNNGTSLDAIEDGTVDFAFSFDSLVHVEEDVLGKYVEQLSRKLSRDGVAFLHHSNFGEYPHLDMVDRLPSGPRSVLAKLRLVEPILHFRSASVTAAKVDGFAREHGLACISQELVPWGTRRALTDCMSTIVKRSSWRVRENRIFRNHAFMNEARYISNLAALYGEPSRPDGASHSDAVPASDAAHFVSVSSGTR